MKKLFQTQRQAVIITSVIIAIIMLATAGTIFALTSSKKTPPEKPTTTTQQQGSRTSDFNGEQVSLDRAKEISLQDAGLKESEVMFTNVKLTLDDGVQVYEVEFTYNGAEYEYEIDAATGVIHEKDVDYDDDDD